MARTLSVLGGCPDLSEATSRHERLLERTVLRARDSL